MVVTAPPDPPRRAVPVDPEALFEEARRRTRRRRRRRAVSALVVVTAAVGVAAWLGRRDDGGSSNAAFASRAATGGAVRNGPITVMESKGVIKWGIYAPGRRDLGRLLLPTLPIGKGPSCIFVESVAWAPDGQRLALGCTSNNASHGLYIADARTRASRIIWHGSWRDGADVVDVAWSPDGSTLAFVSNAGRISLIRDDGSGYRVLHPGTYAPERGPTWSPDGRRIAYATMPYALAAIATVSDASVFATNLEGTHRTLVARHGAWPAWSPDGRTIAYLASCGVRLATPQGKSSSGCIGVHGAPVWSPDGRYIAMAVAHKGIYTMNADGSDLRLFTRVTSATQARLWFELGPAASLRPAWAPRAHD